MTALTHFPFYQKYREPFPIPEITKSVFLPFREAFNSKRHKAMLLLKVPKSALLEFITPFSKEANNKSLTVATTKVF